MDETAPGERLLCHGGVCPQHPLCYEIWGWPGVMVTTAKMMMMMMMYLPLVGVGVCVCVCILVGKERKAGHD